MKETSVTCQKLVIGENGQQKVCGSTRLTKCGSNSWRTLKKATKTEPATKVLVQRFLCKDCGGFNFTNLDGTPLVDDYSDKEMKRLRHLTKQKLQEKDCSNGTVAIAET